MSNLINDHLENFDVESLNNLEKSYYELFCKNLGKKSALLKMVYFYKKSPSWSLMQLKKIIIDNEKNLKNDE